MARTATLLLMALVAPAFAAAQAKPVKDEVVYLKVPLSMLGSKTSFWGTATLTATIAPAGDGAAVNQETNWRLLGFPPLTAMKVSKVRAKAVSGAMPSGPADLELKLPTGEVGLKLSFPQGEAAKLFPLVFATEGERDGYRTETYKALAMKFFGETPLAGLADDKKHALVFFAHMTANGTTMGSVSYKDNLYLLVDLGSDSSVYNDLRMNQSQRVAHVLNERLLAVLKSFAKVVADVKGIYGLKLQMEIPHKSFLATAASPERDALELYAPADLVKKFSDADITNQQFIDGCVVIVNTNRISVPLAAS